MNKQIEELSRLLEALITGESFPDVAGQFKSLVGTVSAQDLAVAQQMVLEKGYQVEDIQRASTLHTNLVADSIEPVDETTPLELIPGHPARVLVGENEGISQFIKHQLKPRLKSFLATQGDRERQDLLADAQELLKIGQHYDRKENLLFPYLERNGVVAPPQVMWGVDDIIRQLSQLFVEAISDEPVQPRRIELVAQRLLTQIEDMIVKENTILLPLLKEHLTEEDWLLVASESRIVGYVFNKGISGASNSDAATWLAEATDGPVEAKPGTDADLVKLPSGYLTPQQLTWMLNTLPTDLTFVDANEVVTYYSEGKHPVFTRTRTIIGRDLYLCHPPQLVPTIRRLIEEFKSGQKDEEIVISKKGSRYDLIRYYAVRNEQGEYLGTLEVTEEISDILRRVEELDS